MDAEATRALVRQIAPEIATSLGDGWSASLVEGRTVLDHRDGRKVYLAVTWDATSRITISGGYSPVPNHYIWSRRPAITVSSTQTPAAIAGEISRRLLPAYEARLAEVGDTIIDATADPMVAGPAGAGGRRYLPVDGWTSLVALGRLRETAALLVLRWPESRGAADAPELARSWQCAAG
jgi:hypothetical protein